MPPLLAHVKWYVDEPHHVAASLALLREPLTIALICGAVAITAAWWLVARRLVRPLQVLEPLGRLAPWMPRILGIHLGVSLLALAVTNSYLAPHLSLDDVPGASALALVEGVVGVWLIAGVRLRPAALVVVALGPVGMVFTGVLPVVEALDTLGVALFLVLLPPGPDRFGARRATADQLRTPLRILRVSGGMALVILAFSEKLLVPGLASELIEQYPAVDVFRIVGVAVPADLYVRIAAITELLFGLMLISGAGVQLVVLVAAVPFNLTLLVFDRFELIGHLPVYGLLLALLVYASSPELRPSARDGASGVVRDPDARVALRT